MDLAEHNRYYNGFDDICAVHISIHYEIMILLRRLKNNHNVHEACYEIVRRYVLKHACR